MKKATHGGVRRVPSSARCRVPSPASKIRPGLYGLSDLTAPNSSFFALSPLCYKYRDRARCHASLVNNDRMGRQLLNATNHSHQISKHQVSSKPKSTFRCPSKRSFVQKGDYRAMCGIVRAIDGLVRKASFAWGRSLLPLMSMLLPHHLSSILTQVLTRMIDSRDHSSSTTNDLIMARPSPYRT